MFMRFFARIFVFNMAGMINVAEVMSVSWMLFGWKFLGLVVCSFFVERFECCVY